MSGQNLAAPSAPALNSKRGHIPVRLGFQRRERRASGCEVVAPPVPRGSISEGGGRPVPASEHPQDSRSKSPGAACWYLRQWRARPVTRCGTDFSAEKFAKALESSSLNSGAGRTMRATLATANTNGLTAVSGAALAFQLSIRPATVSAHWGLAREAGLMLTRRRFNASSIQQLTWPGGPGNLEEAEGSPIYWHPWSDAELLWWRMTSPSRALVPPWREERAPF